jgi:peptidoglycan hydrolase CwlO-like protein
MKKIDMLFQKIVELGENVVNLTEEVSNIMNNVSTLSSDFKDFRKETNSHMEKIDDRLYGIKRRINELEDDSDFLRSKMKGIQQTNSCVNAGKDIQYLYSRKSEDNSISNPDID